MPQAMYIICSEYACIDKDSNFVSCFKILENARLERVEAPGAYGWMMFVVACWMREDADLGQTFEGEITVTPPWQPNPVVTSRFVPFTFPTPIYRMYSPQLIVPQVPDGIPLRSGLMRVEARIRRQGTDEWLRQSHLIRIDVPVEEAHPEIPDAVQPAETNPGQTG